MFSGRLATRGAKYPRRSVCAKITQGRGRGSRFLQNDTGGIGDEERIGVAIFSIDQWAVIIEPNHLAARTVQDRVPGCGVPFHCTTNSRVNIGLARGDQTEFQRRTRAFWNPQRRIC